jgi:O-antigen/teichoic acid export membrane protein
MISFLQSFFNQGHERSIKAKKNIFFLALIKVVGVSTTLLLVPMAINYLNKEYYGIWVAVSSIVAFLALFDVGLSNGLKNKFAESLAQEEEKKAKIYVSTTYFFLFVIFLCLWVVFLFVNPLINWCALLNISPDNSLEVQSLVFIVISYFCFVFVLKTINALLTAKQQPAKASFIDTLGQLCAFITIFILTKTTQGSLVYLGLGLTIPPLIVYLIANIYLFKSLFKKYVPSLTCVKLDSFKDLFGLSFKFFVIQVAALIQYQTAAIIIAHYISMETVADYDAVYKYFHVLLMGFMVILTPFWSASTDAFAKNDLTWIKNAVKRYLQILLAFAGIGTIMLLLSSFAYDIWIGKDIMNIPFMMSFWCLLYMLSVMFGAIYVHLLNGIGAVKIQYYSSLVTPVVFIFLCWFFFGHLQLGVAYYLFIASIICNINGIVFAPFQYRQIFVKGKGGIWRA